MKRDKRDDDAIEISERVGKRIRAYRTSLKMSREKLAERADLHPTYVGQLERGEKNPTIWTLYKVSVGLRVPLCDLIVDPSERKESYLTRCISLVEGQPRKEQERIYKFLLTLMSYKNN